MPTLRFITEGWKTGLVGTIGVRSNNGNKTVELARTTVGITEEPAGSGRYVKEIVVDPVAYPYEHIWDDTVDYASGVIKTPFSDSVIQTVDLINLLLQESVVVINTKTETQNSQVLNSLTSTVQQQSAGVVDQLERSTGPLQKTLKLDTLVQFEDGDENSDEKHRVIMREVE